MLYLNEHRKTPDRLCDVLPWAAFVAPAVILNKDGSFQTTIRYRGPDLDSVTQEELLVNSLQLNNILRRLGSNFSLFFDAQRVASNDYPEGDFPDPVSRLIDQNRKHAFSQSHHFESEYYLTITFLPPHDSQNRLTDAFISKSSGTESSADLLLEHYQAEILRVTELLSRVMQEVRVLTPDETLTYLHSLISNKRHSVKLPSTPMYLDAVLADTPLLGGFNPRLGTKYMRVIGILGYPSSTQPAILDTLNRLPIEYRWSTRFICLDKVDSKKEIETYHKKWFAKRKNLRALITELLTKEETGTTDSDSLLKAEDAQAALGELGSDDLSYGFFTTSIIVLDDDQERLRTSTAQIERVINGAGFVTKVESVNAVEAWLGTLPGNTRQNVRRPLLNTLNLAHLMPGSSAVWGGDLKNEHLNASSLFVAETNGSTPFRYSTHVGDVGHTLILGPTGAGKSTLLNFIGAQFLRYPEAQVYIFDKGASAYALTSVIGGSFHELGAESSKLSFQPLANIDDIEERKWAHEFLLGILIKEGVTSSPEVKRVLWEALEALSNNKRAQRTIFALSLFLQNHELRAALQPYTRNGPHGKLLDNSDDNLNLSKWQCFEMEQLMATPSVISPVLNYLFHRLEARFTGAPTLVILDEAWLFLDSPQFAAKIREWLKTLRKKNVSVIFATQSLADVQRSTIAPAVKEACFTKVYLPNPIALQPDMAEFYKQFGLNQTQIDILARATPKQHYYYSSPSGNRLFDLALDSTALTFCAGATPEQRSLISSLREKYLDPVHIAVKLLESKNIKEDAKALLQQAIQEMAA